MLVNSVAINYKKAENMSPSRRKGSSRNKRFAWNFPGGGGGGTVLKVFSALVVVLAFFIHAISTEPKPKRDLQTAAAQRRQGFSSDYYSSTFKPSPLLETFYDNSGI